MPTIFSLSSNRRFTIAARATGFRAWIIFTRRPMARRARPVLAAQRAISGGSLDPHAAGAGGRDRVAPCGPGIRLRRCDDSVEWPDAACEPSRVLADLRGGRTAQLRAGHPRRQLHAPGL